MRQMKQKTSYASLNRKIGMKQNTNEMYVSLPEGKILVRQIIQKTNGSHCPCRCIWLIASRIQDNKHKVTGEIIPGVMSLEGIDEKALLPSETGTECHDL